MMNLIDLLVETVSPVSGLKRRAARAVLAGYDAAKPSRVRKFYRDQGGPNTEVARGSIPIRVQARELERNHDIARGILRTLVNNVVGPNGIGIEPQPRRTDGSIHEEYATALRDAWMNFERRPEVTWTHSMSKVQRLVAKTWLRDGEAFSQMLIGTVPGLDHGTLVPFSLELFEPDLVPMDYDEGTKIKQGVERNAWGRKIAYMVYKEHPGEYTGGAFRGNLKRVSADRILHVALLDRIGQIRGVSEFASVITRLEDIKDYEESERVAAKIAAKLTAYVKKGDPSLYQPNVDSDGNPVPREIDFEAGMIIDSLGSGEEIGLIDSKRPNPNLVTFRAGQLKAVASGVGAGYSTISKNYDGNYGAQRQELVEQWVNYAVLTDEFTCMFVQPVWEKFVMAAHLSGVVPMPSDVVPSLADDALYIGQTMPWIDPLKEALGWTQLVRSGFASEVEVMRKRGVKPDDVLKQIIAWRDKTKAAELIFDTDSKYTSGSGTAQDYLRFREGTPETDGSPAKSD
jgi:lambda family phage portal protein